jgi:hypothetical protein
MINKMDAPDGYEAIKTEALNCNGCSFLMPESNSQTCTAPLSHCIAPERADNEDVIFKLIDTLPTPTQTNKLI